MIDLPFNPKARQPIELLTADLLKQIYELARQKFDIQGTNKVATFCRDNFKCELSEISIEAAKWVIGHLSELKDFPRRPLPPRLPDRIEGEILPPPAVLDFGGPKL